MRRSQTLAWVAMAMLALDAALSLAGIVSDSSYHDLVRRAVAGKPVSPDAAQSSYDRVRVIGWADLGVYLATAAVFIVWFRDAYRNVDRLGVTGLRWGSRWAVAAWFVPFLNLARPKSILNDIWNGSDPQLVAGSSLEMRKPPRFYQLWWGVWLLGLVVDRVVQANFQSAQTLSALSWVTGQLIFSDVVDLIAAVLALAVVHSVTSRQQQRWRAMTDANLGLASVSLHAPTPVLGRRRAAAGTSVVLVAVMIFALRVGLVPALVLGVVTYFAWVPVGSFLRKTPD